MDGLNAGTAVAWVSSSIAVIMRAIHITAERLLRVVNTRDMVTIIALSVDPDRVCRHGSNYLVGLTVSRLEPHT